MQTPGDILIDSLLRPELNASTPLLLMSSLQEGGGGGDFGLWELICNLHQIIVVIDHFWPSSGDVFQI